MASPFATAGQALLHEPQSSSEVWRSTHWLPQSVGAAPAQPVVHEKPLAVGAQSGAAAAHFALQVPQCAASERSTSQPSAAL